MTLRRKTILIIMATFLSLVAILYFISQGILLNSFIRLEESDTRENVSRVLSAYADEVADLDALNIDWAVWDDSYNFIQNANTAYIKANLVDDTFIQLRLNLILYVNSAGKTVFGKAFDLESEREIPVPASLMEHLTERSPLLTNDTTNSVTGLILIPEAPLIVVSHPILTSESKGPARGNLIMGRYLNSTDVERLAEKTRLSIEIARFNDTRLQDDFEIARSSLSDSEPIFVRPVDNESVAGYAIIKDIYKNPALIVRIDTPRDIFNQGRITNNYLLLSLVVVCLAFGGVTVFLMENQVLSRLSRLGNSVCRVIESGDLSTDIAIEGKDELSNLANTINGMLIIVRHSEKRLRESETRYRAIAENIQDGLIIVENQRTVYVNDRACEIFGYSREELLRMSISDFAVREGPVQSVLAKEMAERTSIPPKEVELWIIRKDGTRRYIHNSRSMLPGSNSYLVVTSDITERKQAGEKIEQLYELEKELRRALEEEMKRRVEFTRSLVHELKTPITPVLASSELLAEELKEEPWSSLAKNINLGAQNLNRRIDELFDLARGEVGMLKLNLQPVDTTRLFQEIINYITPVANGNKQTLHTFLAPLPIVMADEDRLRQVLLNLLNNALKYTPAGGQITLRSRAEDNNIIVEVQDTGPGIDEEEQKRLFQPYYRLARDRERFSGLGLGLALSKSLVELHGGKIWVKAKKGEGSTFAFSIPVRSSDDTNGGTQ